MYSSQLGQIVLLKMITLLFKSFGQRSHVCNIHVLCPLTGWNREKLGECVYMHQHHDATSRDLCGVFVSLENKQEQRW